MKDSPMKQDLGKRNIGGWQAAFSALGLLALSASVHATQTVDPTLTAGGATIHGTTQAVPAGSTFTFYGMYTDDSSGAESGLGLKVKYNPAHLTSLVVVPADEYTKCRIAPAQVQPLTANTAQVVMGWVDTSVRSAGAVGWPDLADTTAGGATTACLNPGSLNTDTAAGTSVAPGLKLFKITATMAPGCTSAGACSSSVLFDSEGNFSYAGSSPNFTNKSFTINGAAAPTLALAAANPYVSRKTHGLAGTFDIAITPSTSIANGASVTVEPRAPQSGSHQIVIAFTAGVTAAEFPTVTAASAAGSLPTTTAFSGSEMIVTIGNSVTPVPNGVRILVSATGAGVAAGVNPSIAVGFLQGDVQNGNGIVQGGDVTYVQQRLLATANASNFKADVDANGTVQGGDVTRVQQRLLTQLP
jgi:Dockerin type I domain